MGPQARLQLAEREVRNLAERGSRTLRIGTFPTAGALLRGLRSRELQAALVFSQPGDRLDLEDDDSELHPLLADLLLLVMPEDHRCAHLDRVPLELLRDDDWVGAADPHDPCDRLLSWACAPHDFEPVHVMRSDDYAVVQGFLAAGTGVSLAPRLALGAPRDDLVVRPLGGCRWPARSAWRCCGRPPPPTPGTWSPP